MGGASPVTTGTYVLQEETETYVPPYFPRPSLSNLSTDKDIDPYPQARVKLTLHGSQALFGRSLLMFSYRVPGLPWEAFLPYCICTKSHPGEALEFVSQVPCDLQESFHPLLPSASREDKHFPPQGQGSMWDIRMNSQQPPSPLDYLQSSLRVPAWSHIP